MRLIKRSLAILLAIGFQTLAPADQPDVDFNRDVRPVLAAKCFACHGPDENKREAGLRLDIREEAIDFGAIVPGSPEDSELVRRIRSDESDVVMPPSHLNDTLTEPQRQLFVDWIEAGAPYATHWAFVPPMQATLPTVNNGDWPRNPIDRFVLAKLESLNRSPAPEADRYTLVRRVYLDLIGLPPTPEEADRFVNSQDPQAYEKLVDQLLASPRYGERWARLWLDLARYSDTNGYEKDRPRSIWPYRDWVIRAINQDMPFDQFSIQQLAGDMLPEPTTEQLIATGFHRNTMLNEEGGIDPLEYRFYAMVDRVATTGTVWLGMSTGCAQCHTHKYDPITHTDYYSLMALMNNADEPDQVIKSAEVTRRRERLQSQIDELESQLRQQFPVADGKGPESERRAQNFAAQFSKWLQQQRQAAVQWNTISPNEWDTNLPRLEVLADGSILSSGDVTKRDIFKLRFNLNETQLPITAIRLEALQDDRLPDSGPGRAYYEGRKGSFFVSELATRFQGEPKSLRFADPQKTGPPEP